MLYTYTAVTQPHVNNANARVTPFFLLSRRIDELPRSCIISSFDILTVLVYVTLSAAYFEIAEILSSLWGQVGLNYWRCTKPRPHCTLFVPSPRDWYTRSAFLKSYIHNRENSIAYKFVLKMNANFFKPLSPKSPGRPWFSKQTIHV